MQFPLKFVPDPIDADAASRNRGARRRACWLLATVLLAACGAGEPDGVNGATAIGADDGTWERLPLNAPIRISGMVSGRFDSGARIEMGPGLCAHLAMGQVEWDALMQTTGAGRRVTVIGYKAAGPYRSDCRIQLDRVGIFAR